MADLNIRTEGPLHDPAHTSKDGHAVPDTWTVRFVHTDTNGVEWVAAATWGYLPTEQDIQEATDLAVLLFIRERPTEPKETT